jgi:hypothetical protein
MSPMPVMMREAALTSMTAKVGTSYCCCDMILAKIRSDLRGEDWDELERKAAKCKANLLSKSIGHN